MCDKMENRNNDNIPYYIVDNPWPWMPKERKKRKKNKQKTNNNNDGKRFVLYT